MADPTKATLVQRDNGVIELIVSWESGLQSVTALPQSGNKIGVHKDFWDLVDSFNSPEFEKAINKTVDGSLIEETTISL